MKRGVLYSIVAAMSLHLATFAAVAADLSVKKTVSLKGSPEATWSRIGDYCVIQNWHPAIAKCEVTSGTNNKAGAIRVLTLGDGATVREELTAYDAKAHMYSYKILESPLPVVSYASTIAVLAGSGGGSIVEWKSTLQAAPGTDDAAAVALIEGFYDAGLGNLAKETTK